MNRFELSAQRQRLLDKLLDEEGMESCTPVRITPRTASDPVPLSFAQERMWFLDQLAPGNPFYAESSALRFDARLDRDALKRSLDEIVRRHTITRTTFVIEDQQPTQVVGPLSAPKLTVHELDHLLPKEREKEVRRLAAVEARQPFDLGTGPLIRTTLLQLGQDDFVFLLTMHHIICDGWSLAIFWRELGELYAAFCQGQSSPLPELPIQYADFAHWQRQELRGTALQQQLDYWIAKLEGLPILKLPTDRRRPAVFTHRGSHRKIILSAATTTAVKAFSRGEDVTEFMTLLSVFAVLLQRYSVQNDIVIGSPIANRGISDVEGLIGLFVNTLVLRVDGSGNPTVRELVGRVREMAVQAYAHQDLPFERLVEELKPERDLSRNPLFQVVFQLGQVAQARAPIHLPNNLSVVDVDRGVAKFDLRLELWEGPDGFEGSLEYCTDLFDAATIARMAEHYANLVTAMVEHPESRISELPLISDKEWREVIAQCNDTATDYPRDASIHEIFAEQVQRSPEAVAIVFDDKRLTYAELARWARRVSNRLESLGVGPETVVAVSAERSLMLIPGLLGILGAGAAYLPLDPEEPEERQIMLLQDAGVQIMLSSSGRFDHLAAHGFTVLDVTGDRRMGVDDFRPVRGVHPLNLAYVMYTSGSTGRPKGVCVPHRSVLRLVRDTDYVNFSIDDVFLQLAPLAFDASTFEIWGCLLNGGRLVIMPPGRSSLRDIGRVIERHGVTTLWLTAGLFHQMVDHELSSLASIRQLLAGGDVLSARHVQGALDGISHCRVINGYGPTENTTFTCCHSMQGRIDTATAIPIGRTIANTRTYILDDRLHPVPMGVPGELYIAGDGLARCYLGAPSATAHSFLPDPFTVSPGGRIYRTGDLVRRLPDGVLEFLGRSDQQVKVRGYRLELGEIETVLKGHENIAECVAAARKDEGGDEYLVAWWVAQGVERASSDELGSYMRRRLPEYMIPSVFVPLANLPLTRNGKIDRDGLPLPDNRGPVSSTISRAPSGEVEEAIAQIWAEVLKLDKVGATDNFFSALGGHSLLATQVTSRICDTFALDMPLQMVFARPTVAELAEGVEELMLEDIESLTEHETEDLLANEPGIAET